MAFFTIPATTTCCYQLTSTILCSSMFHLEEEEDMFFSKWLPKASAATINEFRPHYGCHRSSPVCRLTWNRT